MHKLSFLSQFYYIFWDIFEHLQKLVWNLDSITWNITVLQKVTENVSILNFRAKINRIVALNFGTKIEMTNFLITKLSPKTVSS